MHGDDGRILSSVWRSTVSAPTTLMFVRLLCERHQADDRFTVLKRIRYYCGVPDSNTGSGRLSVAAFWTALR